jgi:hypothetical protein
MRVWGELAELGRESRDRCTLMRWYNSMANGSQRPSVVFGDVRRA